MRWPFLPRYLYLFHHIGKCAGTSLGDALGHCRDRGICLGAKCKTRTDARKLARKTLIERRISPRRLRVFFGHRVYYGLHHLCPHTPRYFTFLRHPVSRVISLYNFHCDNALDPHHRLHQRDRSIMIRDGRLISFEEWFETAYSRNHLVRFLHYAMCGESIVRPRVLRDKQVQAARAFLELCWFIGFTELSRQDIPNVCRAVGVPVPRQRANTSVSHVTDSQVAQLASLIVQSEQLDMEVYEFAWRLRGLTDPPDRSPQET